MPGASLRLSVGVEARRAHTVAARVTRRSNSTIAVTFDENVGTRVQTHGVRSRGAWRSVRSVATVQAASNGTVRLVLACDLSLRMPPRATPASAGRRTGSVSARLRPQPIISTQSCSDDRRFARTLHHEEARNGSCAGTRTGFTRTGPARVKSHVCIRGCGGLNHGDSARGQAVDSGGLSTRRARCAAYSAVNGHVYLSDRHELLRACHSTPRTESRRSPSDKPVRVRVTSPVLLPTSLLSMVWFGVVGGRRAR